MNVSGEAPRADAWLEELPLETCLEHLRREVVGRLGVVVDERPIVLPVNYRLVETVGPLWVTLRTRPGGVVDEATSHVALEIDGIDGARHEGWSVLVRGTMARVDPDAANFKSRFDSEPWIDDRHSWHVIEPFSITGRLLHSAEPQWPFDVAAYL